MNSEVPWLPLHPQKHMPIDEINNISEPAPIASEIKNELNGS